METHYLVNGERARGRERAACGAMVDWRTHASHPTCPDCRRWKEQNDADFLGTFGDPTEPLKPTNEPPVKSHEWTDPLRDYRPGGER